MSEDQKDFLWRAAAIVLAFLVIAPIMHGCSQGGDNKAWAIGTSLMCYIRMFCSLSVMILGGRLTWLGMLRAGWVKFEEHTGPIARVPIEWIIVACIIVGFTAAVAFIFLTEEFFPSWDACDAVQGRGDGY